MQMFNWKKFSTAVLTGILLFMSIPIFVHAQTDKDTIILYTNDVHCAIDDYSKLAAYAAQLEADGQDVIIVDAGDAIQGEVIGSLTQGEAIVDLMNAVGYDYAVPGNHEFDYGMDVFLDIASSKSEYTYLSSNFIDLRENELVLDAYDIVELDEEKIAFIGIATPETYTKSTPAYFQDENGNIIYGFSQSSNETFYHAVQMAVDAAIAEGADRVIAIGHLGIAETKEGWKSTDVIANTTGIDVLLDAHSHEVFAEKVCKNKDGEEVLLSSTGTKLSYFGKLTLDDNGVEKTELIVPNEVDIHSSEAATSAYDKVQAKIEGYNEQIEYLYEVIGTTETDLIAEDSEGNRIVRKQETNAGDFVTDAYRVVTGADIAFCNGGGVRANISTGDVTRKALMDINPYNNEMCVAKVTGQQILDALEYGARLYPDYNGLFLQVSGVTYEIHAYRESPVIMNEDGSCAGIDNTKERRVTNVKVHDEALVSEKEYTVAATKYVLDNHGDGYYMLKDHQVVSDEGIMLDVEMLLQYLTKNLNGIISSEQYGNKNGDGRINIIASEESLYNHLKVAGVSVNKSNAHDILGDGTVSYDAETKTLTLENADLSTTKESENYPIYAKGDLNIILKGKNKLSSDYYYGMAIVDPENADSIKVTIDGDGSLDSYGSDGGIFVEGSLIIGDKANVTVTGHCGVDIQYTLDVSAGILTISGKGDMADYGQMADTPWFDYRNSIKEIVVKEAVTSIGNAAFSGCESLEKVSLPDSLKEIGIGAFAAAGMKEIKLPEGLKTIDMGAFMDSKLIRITIPASVTSLGNIAFSGCQELKEVLFEGNAPKLGGEYVFADTKEDLTIRYYEDATGFDSNVWNNKNIVILKKPKEESEKKPKEEPEKKPKEEEPEKGGAVKTGDSANVMLWIMMVAMSMGVVVLIRRKQKTEL